MLSAENINVVLNNDSDVNLTYTTKLYTKYKANVDEMFDPAVQTFVDRIENLTKNDPNIPVKGQWIPTQELTVDSIIVIVLDIPQFINFKSLNLQGMLLYEKDSKNCQIHLPDISLNVEDVTSEKYAIQMTSILSGTDDAYLSMISASLHTAVKVIIPTGTYRTLDGLLQIDCFFTRAEVNAREFVLVYDGTSRCLKDVLLRVSRHEKEPIVDMYTRNGEQLQLLFHHLYNKIPGVVILNKDCEIIVVGPELRNNQNTSFVEVKKPTESLVKFMDAIKTVLVFAEENLKNCLEEKEEGERQRMIRILNLNKLGDGFRQQLADLEKKADGHLKNAIDEK
ncbi:hypothetical protein CBL_03821 [Carabus blaptoides fortunei]